MAAIHNSAKVLIEKTCVFCGQQTDNVEQYFLSSRGTIRWMDPVKHTYTESVPIVPIPVHKECLSKRKSAATVGIVIAIGGPLLGCCVIMLLTGGGGNLPDITTNTSPFLAFLGMVAILFSFCSWSAIPIVGIILNRTQNKRTNTIIEQYYDSHRVTS